jgi:hypothetical protein
MWRATIASGSVMCSTNGSNSTHDKKRKKKHLHTHLHTYTYTRTAHTSIILIPILICVVLVEGALTLLEHHLQPGIVWWVTKARVSLARCSESGTPNSTTASWPSRYENKKDRDIISERERERERNHQPARLRARVRARAPARATKERKREQEKIERTRETKISFTTSNCPPLLGDSSQ